MGAEARLRLFVNQCILNPFCDKEIPVHKGTAYDKICQRSGLRVFQDGRTVFRLDGCFGHEITTPMGILDAKNRGIDVVFDPERVKTMIDHVNPAVDTDTAIQGQIIRDWSWEHRLRFLDVGRNGICHAVIPEMGWVRPGGVYIMGDSHTCTHGAFCALAAGVGTTALESGIITGLWICPPQQVYKVYISGTLPRNVFAKDVILSTIMMIKAAGGAANAILEFHGPVVAALSMDERLTIANMAIEAGATCGMIMVDWTTINYLWPSVSSEFESKDAAYEAFREANSEPDAVYDQTFDIWADDLEPMITAGFSPCESAPVVRLKGKSVRQVYIGSCTNGRIEDLRVAASIFKQLDRPVHPGVRCIIVPATQSVWLQADQEGLLSIFAEAGCLISPPTCGACLGMSGGVLAPGEVCVSTTNRCFAHRMGKDGIVHLASPATAAIAALFGQVDTLGPNHQIDWIQGTRSTAKEGEPIGSSLRQRPDYAKLRQSAAARKTGSPDFSGPAFYLPAKDVNTDLIIEATHLRKVDKSWFGAHCLENILSVQARAELAKARVLVAGDNFACGSSREQAVYALEALGIRCVIAQSFARIFRESMLECGLLCVASSEAAEQLFAARPDRIFVSWENGRIMWQDPVSMEERRVRFQLSPYEDELIRRGGLIDFGLELADEFQQKGVLS